MSARIVRDGATSDIPNSNTIERAICGDALEVVRGAVRDPAEHDLLGRPAGEEHHHQVDELLARVQVAILGGHVQRVAERLPARDDRRLLRGEELADEVRHDRVAALVVGEDPLLLLGDDAPLLEPRDDALHRRVEVRLPDVAARSRGRRRSRPRCRGSRDRRR